MRVEAERFWKQSQADWKAARDLHQTHNFSAAVFYCHQAIEKALKALHIIVNRELAPRTHNLVELGASLDLPGELAAHLQDLTPEYMMSRYPDMVQGVPAELYSARKTQMLLESTQRCMQWFEKKITTSGSS